jgi:hypothetical protein
LREILAGNISLRHSLPVVVWPASTTNYALQMTTNLTSGNWVTVTNGIPLSACKSPTLPTTSSTGCNKNDPAA